MATMKRCVSLCVTILALTLSAFGQGTIDKYGVYHPTDEEIADNKRIAELLRHPSLISLRLVSIPHDAPREKPSDTPGPYKVKQLIDFQLLITQTSLEKIVIENYLNPYYEYRSELIRDGDVVPYTQRAKEMAETYERRPPDGSMYPVTIERARERFWTRVNLEDWYEPLGPGHYQLTVRKRFAWDGDWVQSNPVVFDVQPRNPAAIPATVKIEMLPQDFQDQPRRESYSLRNDVGVTVFAANDSNRRVTVEVIDSYYANRLELFRDEVLVPYREEIQKLIRSKEEQRQSVEVVSTLFLEPHNRTSLQGLSLTTWYGPLAPGHYKLINRRRFEIDGPWTADSAELSFEVIR